MPIWMTSSKTEQPLFKNYIMTTHTRVMYFDLLDLVAWRENQRSIFFIPPMTYATASYLLRKHGKTTWKFYFKTYDCLQTWQWQMNLLSISHWLLNLTIVKTPCNNSLRWSLRLVQRNGTKTIHISHYSFHIPPLTPSAIFLIYAHHAQAPVD